VQAVTDLKGRKPYFGGGISGDMCINIDLPMLVFRIIGIKGSLFYEDGSYHNFKKQVVLYSLGIANADKFGTNISSYSAIDVKLKKCSLGLYLSAGVSSRFTTDFIMFTSSAILNFQTKRMTFFIQNSSNLANVFYFGNEFSVGLNYRLK